MRAELPVFLFSAPKSIVDLISFCCFYLGGRAVLFFPPFASDPFPLPQSSPDRLSFSFQSRKSFQYLYFFFEEPWAGLRRRLLVSVGSPRKAFSESGGPESFYRVRPGWQKGSHT